MIDRSLGRKHLAAALTNTQLGKVEQTSRFVDNIGRILRQARTPGPFIYGAYDGDMKRLRPLIA